MPSPLAQVLMPWLVLISIDTLAAAFAVACNNKAIVTKRFNGKQQPGISVSYWSAYTGDKMQGRASATTKQLGVSTPSRSACPCF